MIHDQAEPLLGMVCNDVMDLPPLIVGGCMGVTSRFSGVIQPYLQYARTVTTHTAVHVNELPALFVERV